MAYSDIVISVYMLMHSGGLASHKNSSSFLELASLIYNGFCKSIVENPSDTPQGNFQR